MKKTVKVNISGLIYHIEEDAFNKLEKYLDSIKFRFSDSSEGTEIINDLEARIAEIFQSKNKEVIDIDNVNDVIRILGEPEDIADNENPGANFRHSYDEKNYHRKKLYRDVDHSMLGGVASGLGAYFNTDPLIFRVLFVVLLFAFGVTFLIYVILWIVLPPALTPVQKLEMHGKDININNIEQSMKQEYEKVKTNFQRISASDGFKKANNAVADVFRLIGMFIVSLFKVVFVIVGFALIIAGFAAIVALLGFIVFHEGIFTNFMNMEGPSVYDIVNAYQASTNPDLLIGSALVVIIIPLLALIYGGIKLIFRFRAHDKFIGIFTTVVWVIATMMLVSLLMIEGQEYTSESKDTETVVLPVRGDTLFIGATENDILENNVAMLSFNEFIFISKKQNDARLLIKPDIDIYESQDNRWHMEITRESRGNSFHNARHNADNLKYKWKLEKNDLLLDYYFEYPEGEKYRAGYIELDIQVPEGKYIYFGRDTELLIDDDYRFEGEWRDIENQCFVMRDGRLKKAD